MTQVKMFDLSNRLVRLAGLGLALMIGLAFASPASACTGNQCPKPPKLVIQGLQVSGWSGTGGGAVADRIGHGYSEVRSDGGSIVDTNLTAKGDGCPGGCGSQHYQVDASAWQWSQAGAQAGGKPSVGVSVGTVSTATVGFIVEPPPKD